MYSFIFTSKFTVGEMDNYLLNIYFDGVILEDQVSFVQFPTSTNQDTLDNFANQKIDSIEGIQ